MSSQTVNSDGFISETLSADRSILAEDPAFISFDPGGVTRTVTVEAPANDVPRRKYHNGADVAVDEHLYFVDDDGFVIMTLMPGEIGEIWTDGTFYYSDRDGKTLGSSVFHWGANYSTTAAGGRPNGNGEDASTTNNNDPDSSHLMPFEGKIERVCGRWTTGVVANMCRFEREAANPLDATPQGEYLSVLLPGRENGVSDRIDRIHYKSNDALMQRVATATSISTYHVLCRKIGGTTKVGAILPFGANLTTTNNFAKVSGISSTTQIAASGRGSRLYMPVGGNIIGITVFCDTNGGTVEIHVEGASVHSEFLNTRFDVTFFAAQAFNAGDFIEARYVSGTAPGNCIIGIITDLPGRMFIFGGDVTVTNRFLDVMGEFNEAITPTQGPVNEYMMMEPGIIRAAAWHVETSGGDFDIARRDEAEDSVPIGATDGFDSGLLIPFNPGDYITVESDNVAHNETIFSLYAGPT